MTETTRWANQRRLSTILRELIGLPLWGSHRAADLEAFQIGDVQTGTDRKGRPFEAGAYGLHVQSPWRITTHRRIVVAYRDLRYPRADRPAEGFDPNELGTTRREELLEQVFSGPRGSIVIEGFTTSSVGDLRLRLTGGRTLQVFPDISPNDEDPEYWRLLKYHGRHVVVSARGVLVLD